MATVTLDLPAVVAPNGSVGHLVIDGHEGAWVKVACHKYDGEVYLSRGRGRWIMDEWSSAEGFTLATPHHPICRRCQAAIRTWYGGRVA